MHVEVREQLGKIDSFLPLFHGGQNSNANLQAIVASTFTCSAISLVFN